MSTVTLTFDNFEQKMMVAGLAAFRNTLLQESKPTEDIDGLLLKIIDAPTDKCRWRNRDYER